jgi:large subunit ribosomal protein L22
MTMAGTSTKPALEPPVAKATLRYHRGSAQKARLVIDQIRGRNVNDALGLLRFSPKTASRAIEKLLSSAVANAGQGGEKVDVDTLYVGEAYVGPGPSFKRVRGRAFGRAFRILHRTCHITVKLRSKQAHLTRAAVAPHAPAEESGTQAAPATAKKGGARKPAARSGARKTAPARKRKA